MASRQANKKVYEEDGQPSVKCKPGMCLVDLRENTKTYTPDMRSPGRDFKPGHPKYEVLTK
jgi:hypothetical protein